MRGASGSPEAVRTLKAALFGEPFEYRGRMVGISFLDRLVRSKGMDVSQTVQAAYSTATRAGDIEVLRNLGAPGATVWHNHDAQEVTWEQSIQMIGWMHRTMPDVSWEDVAIRRTPEGFVWQVVLSGSAPSGSVVAQLCMVVGVSAEGLISRIEEYMDPASFAPLTG